MVERSRRNCRLIADLRSQGLAVEAVRHAAAAGDQQLLPELMIEHRLLAGRPGLTTAQPATRRRRFGPRSTRWLS
jgi:hypothetical protein